ncbi:HBL325Wp [Eremothecium sinecaudum]|uniref:Protein EFR3 n=1 Tax=Eremothecium sinecaudum TaxID=45286 RepID=A0A109UWR6_9SACH|nr:HBL325Wp [Eremothecium sinecaudum]AMD18577.1 HBL325Wp [Eremothecium sinecaudum]
MVSLFSPKHQKLVNQCYPTGRTPDKKPKSSETSYLLYYVNSRRTKLEKVGAYLVKRTTTDLNHRRIGNVMVTLELLDKIIVSCKENLNVFLKEFLDIMIKTLNNNNFNIDVSVVEKIETAFGSICQHLDGVLCNGDLEFIQMYETFVNIYFQVVTERLKNDDLLMKGCLDISKTTSLASNPQVSVLMARAVELALCKFQELHLRFQGEYLDVDLSPSERRLSRSQTHVAGLEEVQNPMDYSEMALQSFFNTTETDKLSISIRALIKRLIEVPNKDLLQYISNRIPVQLRYIIILLFTRALTTHDESSVVLLKLMTTLLVSEVSIIGLSVLDFMRKITAFQLSNTTHPQIVDACTQTISALNRKCYYKDQSLDMVSELLLKLKDISSPVHKEILIGDLNAILKTISAPFITLDVFLEVAPYVDNHLELFSFVTEKIPGGFVMNMFFRYLINLKSKDEQEAILDAAFAKFKHFTLFSGLICFLEEGYARNNVYYSYHMRAAKFLELEDYYEQALRKKRENELFTRKDLVNYYSDPGCNKYAEKGLRILILQTNRVSSTDLVFETPPDGDVVDSSKFPLTPTTSQLQSKMLSNSDISIKSLDKLKTPKVSDLKKAARGIRLAKSHGSLHASQSIKSKITNITFLLNELNNDRDAAGVEDSEYAQADNSNNLVSPSPTCQMLSVGTPKKISLDDSFHDASADVSSTFRGKLFSS